MNSGSITSDSSKYDSKYVRLETRQIVARFVELEDKNKSISSSLIRLYIFLLLYAAAPFSLPIHFETGFLRVWGFGGLWLAIVMWIQFDRGCRSYGRHLFERIYCIRQLTCLRKLVNMDSENYRNNTLLVVQGSDLERPRCGDPTHVSSSQVSATIYFYKILSLFPPLYFILFIALILVPTEMLDPNITTTREIYGRFVLAFSSIMYLWGAGSTKNCLSLQEQAFRARRISIRYPWPLFPDLADFLPTYAKVRKILYWSLWILAAIVSLLNLIRFFYLMVEQSVLDCWQSLDFHLLYVSVGIFAIWVLYTEIEARYILSEAKRFWPSPKNWLEIGNRSKSKST